MKKVALQIEHKFKNRVVAVHLLDEQAELATIGSARTANLRLMGADVAGLHASLERAGDHWVVSDLGSPSGTWINQKTIVEQSIEHVTVVHIGQHQLKVTPRVIERDLFNKKIRDQEGQSVYHQAVVLRRGLVQKSVLLKRDESFESGVIGLEQLPAPTGFEWVEHEIGEWIVKQRLTKSDVIQDSLSHSLDWQRPAPLAAALLLVAMMTGVMFMMPSQPDDQLKTLTPEMQNQYTRMIFDGKKVRQKREVAEKLRKSIKGQSQTGVAKATSGGDAGAKVAGGSKGTPGAKVVTNLKNAGLGALIGKVAARASKSAQLVEAAGVAADSQSPSGRALGLGGGSSLDKLGGGGGGTGSETMKVGGLGTAGKGGGVSGYKGSGALSLGNVGNAEVGVLEEETEIDGGLDKEAIARVIRSQLGQIRYCYERQLSASPDLYGKILVRFTIGAAGSVVAQTIGTTSLNNAMVEGCILRRIAGWQFPTPKGGTNVLVTYPFLFKSTK